MSPKLHFEPASMLIALFCVTMIYQLFQGRAVVTMKIRSRSLKSNLLFSVSKQCIYASLVKIPTLVQSLAQRNPILDISECRCDLQN